MSTPEAQAQATRGAESGGAATHTTRLVFLASMTVLAAAYTVMAFQMEWRIQSGQIGPGFFPRFVGVAVIVGCLVAIALTLRGRGAPEPRPDPAGDADTEVLAGVDDDDGGTAPLATLLLVGSAVIYYLTFEPLGALLASVLFLALSLSIVNRGHHRVNAAVSILVPVGLYLLFEVLLDAGLPPGLVLPL
jgi:putative tricarboxylic transport membrane protein